MLGLRVLPPPISCSCGEESVMGGALSPTGAPGGAGGGGMRGGAGQAVWVGHVVPSSGSAVV